MVTEERTCPSQELWRSGGSVSQDGDAVLPWACHFQEDTGQHGFVVVDLS